MVAYGVLVSMKRVTVGYQGEPGAYSEEAVISHFRDAAVLTPFRTVTEVFEGVSGRGLDMGVIPVENSIGGNVYESYDQLISSDLIITAEIYLRIHHCLISNEGAAISGVRRVYSHPQALEQCRRFVRSLGAEMVSAYDTAGSVKSIKESGSLDCAAIASRRAADIYGLKVLKSCIEDSPDNITRFLVVGREGTNPQGRSKSSVAFKVPDTPGSLYSALGCFAGRGINLTKIESRPTKGKPWEYYFLLDFEGSLSDRLPSEALRELSKSASFVKTIGSYPLGTVY